MRAGNSSDIGSIQTDPTYQKAQKHFQSGEKAVAASLLADLQKRSDYTPSQTAFIERQIALCAGKSEPIAVSSPAPTPTPRLVTPDCGPQALHLVCQRLSIPATVKRLATVAKMTDRGTSLAGLARAAKSVGLEAKGIQTNEAGLAQIATPAIAWVDGNHYWTVLKVNSRDALIRDPNEEKETTIPLPDLLRRSGGVILLVSRPGGKENR